MKRLMFKQRIAEYFNSQLDLIIFFENLATRLADYAPEHRQELLVKNLEHLSSHLMNGLVTHPIFYFRLTLRFYEYFPLQHSANLPHLTLQAPIPEEGRIMSSKAKVFLHNVFYTVKEKIIEEIHIECFYFFGRVVDFNYKKSNLG